MKNCTQFATEIRALSDVDLRDLLVANLKGTLRHYEFDRIQRGINWDRADFIRDEMIRRGLDHATAWVTATTEALRQRDSDRDAIQGRTK